VEKGEEEWLARNEAISQRYTAPKPAEGPGRASGSGDEVQLHLHPSDQTISVKFPCADKSFSLECQTKGQTRKQELRKLDGRRAASERRLYSLFTAN